MSRDSTYPISGIGLISAENVELDIGDKQRMSRIQFCNESRQKYYRIAC